jgi:hypothetical protein
MSPEQAFKIGQKIRSDEADKDRDVLEERGAYRLSFPENKLDSWAEVAPDIFKIVKEESRNLYGRIMDIENEGGLKRKVDYIVNRVNELSRIYEPKASGLFYELGEDVTGIKFDIEQIERNYGLKETSFSRNERNIFEREMVNQIDDIKRLLGSVSYDRNGNLSITTGLIENTARRIQSLYNEGGKDKKNVKDPEGNIEKTSNYLRNQITEVFHRSNDLIDTMLQYESASKYGLPVLQNNGKIKYPTKVTPSFKRKKKDEDLDNPSYSEDR